MQHCESVYSGGSQLGTVAPLGSAKQFQGDHNEVADLQIFEKSSH